MDETMTALERLAPKQGLTLANLGGDDLQLVLALAARCLPVGSVQSEREVNNALKGWLAATGAMLRVDHVELRRTLIDFQLWQRDGFGHAYRRLRSLANAGLARHASALAQFDAERFVAVTRAQHAAGRAQRKANHGESIRGKMPSPAPLRP